MNSVSTPAGDVALLQPSLDLLRTIRQALPFGAVRYEPPQEGARFGLIMQCGEEEVLFIKRQPPDTDRQQALVTYQANSILISHALAGFLGRGLGGLLLPCAYLREKPEGRYESGIAWFGSPPEQEAPPIDDDWGACFDRDFCHGFTAMTAAFLEALKQSSAETRITLSQPIGLDCRKRLQLGALGFGFMVVGSQVICLKIRIDSTRDPSWTALRDAGIEEVVHLPSVPAAIGKEELKISRDGIAGYMDFDLGFHQGNDGEWQPPE